jgi:hypothetical protein
VGIFGFGGDNKKVPTSALEQASSEPGGASGMVVNLIQPLLDVGIDGKGPLPSAQAVADGARAKSRDVEDAIDRVVRQHLAAGGTGGFLTGLGGFVTMPVALPANVLEFYLVATRMTAAIAALRGYDLTHPPIRSAVLLALVGADADDLIRKAGIPTPTGRLTDLAAQRLPGPALMVLNKAIAFRLVSNVGKSAFTRLGRAVPVLGGVVSAGLDAYMLRRIAAHARREFPLRTATAGQVTAS